MFFNEAADVYDLASKVEKAATTSAQVSGKDFENHQSGYLCVMHRPSRLMIVTQVIGNISCKGVRVAELCQKNAIKKCRVLFENPDHISTSQTCESNDLSPDMIGGITNGRLVMAFDGIEPNFDEAVLLAGAFATRLLDKEGLKKILSFSKSGPIVEQLIKNDQL